MPIKKRGELQAPATETPKVYIPSPDAVLTGIDKPGLRVCSYLAHAGADPTSVPTDDLVLMLRNAQNKGDNMEQSYRNRIRSKATGIRAFCVLCAGGAKGARMCSDVVCPLWAFRMGSNPLRNRK
ncbi:MULTISPECIES: hypothetical protein [unclassified Bradyrhizobium]|uniref:hypothetical protein n=1 Tax=unclassified Bradyrhizobium TaxID=2631580 RepID=UPI0033944C97